MSCRSSILSLFLAFSSLLLLTTCSKENRYSVPAEVEVYVQRFEDEAAARGLDLEIKRLIITMVDDLQSDDGAAVAGRCKHRGARKPRIELDANFANLAPEIQEQLVFHELGHCILDRPHDDETFSNGHYHSLMNSFYWNYMAGQNFKRDYYLDELFSEASYQPEWVPAATSYSAVSASQMTDLFIDEFDNNGNNWNINNLGSGHTATISNGYMRISTNADNGLGLLRNFNINPGNDYQIEIRFSIIEGNEQTNALMVNMGGDFNYFGLNDAMLSSIGILDAGEAVVNAVPAGMVNSGGFNTLTIRVIDDVAYFFVNEVYLDRRIIGAQQVQSLGFFVGADAVVDFDYLYVHEINL